MLDFPHLIDLYLLPLFLDVDFADVEVLTGRYAGAGTAFVAGRIGAFAVEGLREIACRGLLATSRRTHQQIRMRDAFAVDGAL